jgi:hypothetical protein
VYVDEGLLRGARVMAARTGKRDSDIFEAALKSFLGWGILERSGHADLSEEAALELADQEVHRARRQRR